MAKAGLGRGLASVFTDAEIQEEEAIKTETSSSIDKTGVIEVDIQLLKPNPYQPRHEFSEDSLKELSDSIKEHGVIQPVIVEEADNGQYYIIAGERRTRASRMAGLQKIPVIIRKYSNERKLEIALIENIQRSDLNPVEEALAYKQIMDMGGLNQEEVASRVGKKRSTVANALRILKLPEDMLGSLSSGQISPGHARAILSVVNPADQRILFGRILGSGMSVREAEQSATELNSGLRGTTTKKQTKQISKDPFVNEIEQKFINALGTKVTVKGNLDRGSIQIDYFSRDDLDRLYSLLEGEN